MLPKLTIYNSVFERQEFIKFLGVLLDESLNRQFKRRIEEHMKKDNKSHVFKHLHSTTTCFDSYNSLLFKIIDKANSKFNLKIKEALHFNWKKPNFNA